MPVSLLTLSMIRLELQEILKVGVDIVHGPIEGSEHVMTQPFKVPVLLINFRKKGS